MTFHSPWALAALVLIPLLAALYVLRQRRPRPAVTLPGASAFRPLTRGGHGALRHLPALLRLLALALLIVAVARPQTVLEEAKIHAEGIDIVIALDISTSMLAQDLEPDNRLEAAKRVARDFIEGRTSDRIGLVMFAGEAFTWSPLTLDYTVLSELMGKVEAGTVADGTAIGKAIASGTNRLREGGESKVLILLTDGVNNVDQPDPLTAASAAAGLGVKIYTIGVGTQGTARAPVQTPSGIRYRRVQVEIDEELLREIAEMTGGRYFRATSTEALRAIYQRIDEMERTEVEVEHVRHYSERFYTFAAAALVVLLLERLLVLTRLRRLAV